MYMLRMVVVSLGLLGVSFLAGCGGSGEDQTGGSVPTRDGVPADKQDVIELGQGYGPIRFGMSGEDLVAVVGEPQRKGPGTYEYLDLGYAVVLDRQGHVGAMMCGKRFSGLTPEGIGMGSTPEEVVSAYGHTQSQSQTGLLTMSYRSLGAEFTFRDNKLVHIVLRPARP